MALTVAATISRAELGLGNLQLNQAPYTITPEISPGQVEFRRATVESPYVEGTFSTHVVKGQGQGQVVIDVRESTHAAAQTAIQTLIDAFTQSTFVFTLSLNGTSYAWDCETADYSVGFAHERLHAIVIPVAFSFPRFPTANQGPI